MENELKSTLAVLESMQNTVSKMGGDAKGVSNALKIAMEAVRKQIPEKARKNFKIIPDHLYYIVVCPLCGADVFPNDNNCRKCGKRLDWTSTKMERGTDANKQ